MSKLFDDFWNEVEKGEKGENGTIPLQLGRLDEYLEISKATMYLIGAQTSDGKTSFALDQFMIYPLIWYMNNKNNVDMKLDIIYFCLERSQIPQTAKMLSKFIFEDTGILIPVKKMLGRKKDKITPKEKELILQYKPIVDEMMKYLQVKEGGKKVDEIKDFIHAHAKKSGKIVKVVDDNGEVVDKYQPNHPNAITLIIVDHIGLISKEKKEIDAFSDIMRKSKDFYGYSPCIIQQLNRNISTSDRNKATNAPKLSDFEGTSSTAQDAEVCIAIYNPFTQFTIAEDEEKSITDKCGYDLTQLRDQYGIVCYRSLVLLKNTYGGAGLQAGLAFHAPTGTFKTMPKLNEITEYDYRDITSGKFFVSKQGNLF